MNTSLIQQHKRITRLRAERFVELAREQGLPEPTVGVIAGDPRESGIGIFFEHGGRKAYVEFLYTGKVGGVLSDRGTAKQRDLPITDTVAAISRIAEHLLGQP